MGKGALTFCPELFKAANEQVYDRHDKKNET